MSFRVSLAPLLAAALLLWPALAGAGDEVGVFFDTVGEENCILAEQFSTLDAFLLLLEPSVSVGGWECLLEAENVSILSVTLAGQAVNAGPSLTDFMVGLAYPLPADLAVKLAQVSVLVMGGDPVGFFIYPGSQPSIAGTPAYADGSDPSNLIPMTPRTIGANSLVAGINRPACIPEHSTWGSVKSIYLD